MFISVWDNLKHLFIIYTLFRVIQKSDINRIENFKKILFVIMSLFFYIESLLVIYQYTFLTGSFDDITGFFGYHASHSVGYFTLLYIIILLSFIKTRKLYLVFVVVLAIIINYMSENIGFYVLLLFMLFVYNYKYMYALLFLPVFLLIPWVNTFFINVFISRLNSFFLDTSRYLPDEGYVHTGRMPLLQYAIDLGGLFGGGIGAFSNIYNLVGYRVDELMNSQLNISTLTNITAEYGLFGLVAIILLYMYMFKLILKNRTENIVVSILLIISFSYSRVLMDERIIYMLIFIILVFSLDKNKYLKGYTNKKD